MAIDNTPPRLKLIVTIAVITVVTLVSLDFVFKSYYATMTDEAQREKIAPTTDKYQQVNSEAVAFAQAAVPLDRAMAQLGKGRPDAITPQVSDDTGALVGWNKLPKPIPAPVPSTPAPASSDDAGTVLSADGGATPLAGDAGAATDGGARGDAGKPAH